MPKSYMIKKEMMIEEVLERDSMIPTVLLAMGMERFGLPLMSNRSLEDICIEEGIDADEATERINEFLSNKKHYNGEDEDA